MKTEKLEGRESLRYLHLDIPYITSNGKVRRATKKEIKFLMGGSFAITNEKQYKCKEQ